MNFSNDQALLILKSVFSEVNLSEKSGMLFLHRGLVENMEDFNKLLNLGILLRSTNLSLSDLIFERLELLNVGHGELFSQSCMNSFIHHKIDERLTVGKTGNISAAYLGRWGRFGNQLLQFMLLVTLGLKLNFSIHYPKWIGNYLFNIQEPPSNIKFNPVDEIAIRQIYEEKLNIYDFDIGTNLIDVNSILDFRGYFKNLLQFKPKLNFLGELKTLGFKPESSLAIHIRLSDFVERGAETQIEGVTRWLRQNLSSLNIDNIWILTDDITCLSEFSEFGVNTLSTFKKSFDRLSFLYDWQLLQNSKYCIINNSSTFSSTATFLSAQNQVIISQNKNGDLSAIS
jgi:hypothetical protein